MEAAKLVNILGLHVKYLNGEPGGERAGLHGADLRSANLYGANLHGADLRSANLYGADLYGANLCGADLRGANLHGADLRSANLYGANLRSANLHGADLRSADLRSANLYGANLRSANLYDANLGSLRVAQVGPIGSRRDYLIACWGFAPDGTPVDAASTGCFRGTLAKFRTEVTQTHGTNAYGLAYGAAIALVEVLRTTDQPAPPTPAEIAEYQRLAKV